MTPSNNYNRVPVICRGVTYPSMKACADAYGVLPSTVSIHLNRYGHLDRLGLGQARPGHKNAKSIPVQLGGLSYCSIKSAAEDLGVRRRHIKTYVKGTCHHKTAQRILKAIADKLQENQDEKH